MNGLIEYICDERCKYPDKAKNQQEMDGICANCRILDLLEDERREAFLKGIMAGRKAKER